MPDSFKNFIIITLIIILIFLNYSNLNYFFPQSDLTYSDKSTCRQHDNTIYYQNTDIDDDMNNIYDKENNNIINDLSSNIIGSLTDKQHDVTPPYLVDPTDDNQVASQHIASQHMPINSIDNNLSSHQNNTKPMNELPINSNAIDNSIAVSNLSDHELIHIENTKPFYMHDDIAIVNTVEYNINNTPPSEFNYLKKFSKNFHYCNSDDIYSKY
jgi:hypothetical protein